ncbi:unnamed protein product [Clonostachys solani]|uniref:HD domain-containing protein n=1 Tax=Clonostachys solani TaxID=160281 RepID=A0A9N9W641_9HYPO|nr:unnamed protein product [Clonostachys solani]
MAQTPGSPTKPLPVRTIAGVTVVDTQIVRDAQQFAREHSTDWVYRHVMRAWLFGVQIISHNPTLQQGVDLEAHAIATLLHDLGWHQTSTSSFVSDDKRFEVDGAIAARDFIRNHQDGKLWDEYRVQRVWDAIALHTQPSIADYKELDVKVTGNGVLADFAGPIYGVTKSEYDAIVQEFPNDGFLEGVNNTIVWLCRTKPQTTVDTWQQRWGEHHFEDYPPKGFSFWDLVHR